MALSPRDFETVRHLVQAHAALVLEPGKAYWVESRLGPISEREGLPGVEALIATLREKPFDTLHAHVVDALTATDTSFFRDVHPFEALRSRVIPDLLRRRAMERKLHFWCAGSSSGQEPYAIAMLLREHADALRDWQCLILATDRSAEMLARARAGRFSRDEANRGLPASLLVKHFIQRGDEFELRDDVRRMVEFRGMNLARRWPPLPPMDVVFLRNVLLYFDLETKREILGRMRRVLRPDGLLFLGASETTLLADDAFERVPIERSWAYRLRPSAAT